MAINLDKYIKKLKIGNDFNLLSLNDQDITVENLYISIDIKKIKSLINYYVDLIKVSKNQKIKKSCKSSKNLPK